MSAPLCISSQAFSIPNTQAKSSVSIVANKTKKKVPPQKSNSSTTPFFKKKITGWHKINTTTPKITTAFFRVMSNSSSKKATAGCARETEEVKPAKNNKKNQIKLNITGQGSLFKIKGIVTNPRLNTPALAID